MGKVTKELTSFQRTVALITVAALAIYSGINVFLVINAYNQLDDNINEFGEIIGNWQTGAIVDIKVAANCDLPYEPAIKDRYWPGTNPGCYCNPNTVSEQTKSAKNITCSPFCDTTCSAVASQAGCQNVPGRGPQLMSGWATQGSTKVQICLKRSLDTWADVAPKSTGTCPAGTKTCSSGKTLFCTRETECPITSITIDSVDVIAADITNCQNDPLCRVLGDLQTATPVIDMRRIRFGRGETGKLPLAEFTTNEYNMCKLKTKANTTPGRPVFPLLKDKPTTCGDEGGTRWVKSSTNTESRMFQVNGLTSYISTDLPAIINAGGLTGYYKTGQNGDTFNWHLFTRPYIPFEPACRNRMESLISKKRFVDDMKTAQMALLIIGCLASFFCIVLAIMEIQNLRGVDLSCFDGKGEEERTKLKRFKKFVNFFFKGLQIPFQIWAIVLTGAAKALFIDLSDEQCSTPEVNGIMSFLATTLTKTYSSNISALGILAATLLLDLILERCTKKKEKENATSPQEIGNASLAHTSRDDTMRVTDFNENKISKADFGKPAQPTPTPPPQIQPQAAQPQTIVIQLSAPPTQTQAMPQQQYPPQYPPQQYPPQGYPPQQYPPQQYPPQGYPPQQYPPQGYPPQQQYPPHY